MELVPRPPERNENKIASDNRALSDMGLKMARCPTRFAIGQRRAQRSASSVAAASIASSRNAATQAAYVRMLAIMPFSLLTWV